VRLWCDNARGKSWVKTTDTPRILHVSP
jgi:hypothetical protein